jgi:hypothetical protein
MFDEQPQNGGSVPPSNLPVEPTDMLSGVDTGTPDPAVMPPQIPNALSSGLLKPKNTSVAPSPSMFPETTLPGMSAVTPTSQPILGKIILAILLVVLLVLLGFGGWWLFNRIKNSSPQITGTTKSNVVPAVVVTPTTSQSTKSKTDTVLFGSNSTVDSDNDGLTDQEETQLGANLNNPDVDGDGLSDGDEVKTWHTNPLVADTDGDGFTDGMEIMNGYNPNGPGKLINPPVPAVRFVTSTLGDTTTSWQYISSPIKDISSATTTL